MSRTAPRLFVLTAAVVMAAGLLPVAPTAAAGPGGGDAGGPHRRPPMTAAKHAVARGAGGAVASVDANATAIGVRVLRNGGTAADAVVATAAALGVTEPYSSGIGGGGYLVYYDAKADKVSTLDGRETAPRSMRHNAFINPETGHPYRFTPERVTSGVAVGVPGTLKVWATAARRWGRHSLGSDLRPATGLARRGFVVDPTFRLQTEENKVRLNAFGPTQRLFLPDGDAPAVGSVFRNPDLAHTYTMIAKRGPRWLYRGELGREIVHNVRKPPTTATTPLPAKPGTMTRADLRRYRVITRKPTSVNYRGLTVYGMPPSSSGGTTIGEALNILQDYNLPAMPRAKALHLYLEASARAYADRGAYLGDPAYTDVPTKQLLSQGFADERACTINPTKAAKKPVAAGKPDGTYHRCAKPVRKPAFPDTEGLSTTHVVASDRWGDVASYTLTIEQTGGSGIVVPGRGFLLNNELTDFTAAYDRADPNRIDGGKRPRSSMSPTLVFQDGRPLYAIGSPGGATIITTVLQTLLNVVDFGMRLPAAVDAPRVSQENTTSSYAEQRFIDRWGKRLAKYHQKLTLIGEPGTSASEIGAVTAIHFLQQGHGVVAVAEKSRRGGGAAGVVHPVRRR